MTGLFHVILVLAIAPRPRVVFCWLLYSTGARESTLKLWPLSSCLILRQLCDCGNVRLLKTMSQLRNVGFSYLYYTNGQTFNMAMAIQNSYAEKSSNIHHCIKAVNHRIKWVLIASRLRCLRLRFVRCSPRCPGAMLAQHCQSLLPTFLRAKLLLGSGAVKIVVLLRNHMQQYATQIQPDSQIYPLPSSSATMNHHSIFQWMASDPKNTTKPG